MRALMLALLLSGCGAMIDPTSAPRDWPRLSVSVHRVSVYEVVKRCSKYLTPTARVMGLGLVGGCAEINFAAVRCDIWIPHEADEGVLEHEMDHCFGKDHPGDSNLRTAWNTYKEKR